MFIQITSPDGQDLGATPINNAIEPCDGSYGLLEFFDGDTDKADRIEGALIDLLRDASEPIATTDFNPQVGTKVTFEGFTGEIVE